MGTTPEGKVKRDTKKMLEKFKPGIYTYWPVPTGYGTPSLDCLICFRGLFISVETKRPGEEPTPRQDLCINEMRRADGAVFVIDDQSGIDKLEVFLKDVAATRQPKT